MKTYQVALLGFGTIGTGVAKILINNRERISRAASRPVELVKICDKDTETKRGVALPHGVLTSDIESIFNDPNIETVIELIGGIEPAKTFVLRLLKSGKNVITANKALLAQHGAELFDAARTSGKMIAFEAAVCGGIPILSALSTALQANTLQSINAIVNGTSNFILTQMESGNTSYQNAVAEAQRLGYAEANPAMDVNGTDAVQKLTILAQLGFGAAADWKNVAHFGIESVESFDFRYAEELGYRIKLLAVAEQSGEGLELHVSPTLVKTESTLAQVSGAFNAVQIVGDSVGPVFFHGLGAGQLPTASAVVGDLIDTILGRTAITFNTLNLWNPNAKTVALKNQRDFYGRSYLRFHVQDEPGVLHVITGVLGKHGISIATLIQHTNNHSANDLANVSGQAVLILTTHEAREGDLLTAIAELEQLPSVSGKIVRMRVKD